MNKRQTNKVVKNAIKNVAVGHDINKVLDNQAEVTVKNAEKTAVKVNKTAIMDAKQTNTEEKTADLDTKFATTGISPAESFKRAEKSTENKEPGLAIVCNINGINVSDGCRIECAPNPKRPGSKAHQRYATYADSKTIKEYLDNGGLKADLRYDADKGFLKVIDVVREGKMVELEQK